MAEILKRKQVRVYLSAESENHLARLHESISALTESDIMTTILSAGLRSCAEHGYRMPLPLKFKLSEEVNRLNEPLTTYTKRK